MIKPVWRESLKKKCGKKQTILFIFFDFYNNNFHHLPKK